MGVGDKAQVELSEVSITPARARIGGSVAVSFVVSNTSKRAQRVLVDFQIHYVKASGQNKAKVFKLKTIELAAGQSVALGKKITLAELTTRKHYPGVHKVDALINGRVIPLGSFQLLK
jgi:hypothetical protein